MIAQYILVLFLVVLRRLLFPLAFLVIPFRGYLRNTIYNYHLNNDIVLKRLYERMPKLSIRHDRENKAYSVWILDGRQHSSCRGIIRRKHITLAQYILALPLWLLLDDDCNEDTYDKGFNQTIVEGIRKPWLPSFIRRSLARDIDKANMISVRGNSFDLGDIRADYPLFGFWSVLLWSIRNPAYNFNYKFNQLCTNRRVFSVVIFNRIFGWWPDGSINNIKCYNWEFGKRI